MPLPLAGLATAALPMVTAALSQAQAGGKQAGQISKELLGYDFIGLLAKLAVFFTAAYAFAKFMEFVVHGTGFVKFVLEKLFGITSVEGAPEALKSLFLDGYNGVKYWDLIKGMAIIMIGFEAYFYYKSNKDLGGQPSVLTLGIFGVIESALIVTTIPELLGRLNRSRQMTLSIALGAIGSNLQITATGLLPTFVFTYSWREKLSGSQLFSRELLAGIDGSTVINEQVPTSARDGDYIITIDQSSRGGPKYEAQFHVIGGISA